MTEEIIDDPNAHYSHIEDMLIHNLVIFPNCLDNHNIDEGLFLDKTYAAVYKVIMLLRSESAPITLDTIKFKYSLLSNNLPFDFDGLWAYRSINPSVNLAYWVKQLKDRALKLSLQNELLKSAMVDKPAEEKAASLIQNIGQLVDKYAPKSTFSFDEDWAKVLNVADDALNGIFPHSLKTFYPALDNIIESGIQDDYFCVLAAYSGTGKTTLALNFAKNISMNLKYSCAILCFEMGRERLMRMYMSACTSIPANHFINGKITKEQIAIAINVKNNNLPPNALDILSCEPEISKIIIELKAHIRKRPECKLIIIDYIGLISYGRSSNAIEAQSVITSMLREFSRTQKVPILLLAQFKKPSTTPIRKDEDKIPSVHNIIGSTSIVSNADLIMLAQVAPGFERMLPKRMIQVFVQKNRGGAIVNDFANLMALGDSTAIVDPATQRVFTNFA